MAIIVDSREKKPVIQGIRKRLIVGDYTTIDLEGVLHIERKSPADLYSTITSGHERFRRQILRASENKIFMPVVVEVSRKEFLSLRWDKSKKLIVKPKTLSKIIKSLQRIYGIKFIWCENRIETKNKIFELLWKYRFSRTVKH